MDKLKDEELAVKCRENIDEAEHELLSRYMNVIYWLPAKVYGVDEEDLSAFLIFAIEKIRERHTLSKFDASTGVKFSTWFGVVIKNLYHDYLRTLDNEPEIVKVDFDKLDTEYSAKENSGEFAQAEENAFMLLKSMDIKCRTLFKLLFANSFFLEPEEMRWIAKESKKRMMQVIKELAEIENGINEKNHELSERYNKLMGVYWWKRRYARQLYNVERSLQGAEGERRRKLEEFAAKLEKRRVQYYKMLEELSASETRSCASYEDLSSLLQMNMGTLGSTLSRCRKGAASIYNKLKRNKHGR
jgi:RNA polymerase sigma factor (sigma-70 family)